MKQYKDDNVFAKILTGDLPFNKVYEDEFSLSFYTINPLATTHVLIIPKGKYVDYEDFISKATTKEVVGFFCAINKIAKQLNLESYKLITNCGKEAGQEVFHFHFHILAGKLK